MLRVLHRVQTKLEGDMKSVTKITLIGAAAAFVLTIAMSSMMVSTAKATPQIAQGKPCGTCHTGSPPSKGNLKK